MKTPQKTEKRSPLSQNIPHVPGQSLDVRIRDLGDQALGRYYAVFTLTLLTTLFWLCELLGIQPDLIVLTGITVAAIIWASIDFLKQKKTIGNHILGRDGEREVGHYLETLRADGYQVLHDIDTSRGNIDHLLIGPNGIFSIETKTRSKAPHGKHIITFDETAIRLNKAPPETKPITQAKAEAKHAEACLLKATGQHYAVHPLVLFPGWFVIEPNNAASMPVRVLNPKMLPYHIKKSPDRLSPDEVSQITVIFSDSSRPQS